MYISSSKLVSKVLDVIEKKSHEKYYIYKLALLLVLTSCFFSNPQILLFFFENKLPSAWETILLKSKDLTNKHYLGIDFEFNKVSKTDRDVALMQINLENDSNNGYIFALYPPELSKEDNKILIDLLTNTRIIKILHGSESLDIPYLFNQLLITSENINNFCIGFNDTKYLCDYLHLEKGLKGKCSIYNLLADNKVITQNKVIELEKIEEITGPIYLVKIDVHNMSEYILKYSLYDVIYLPELIKKFLSISIVYTHIIPNISCLINKFKRNC